VSRGRQWICYSLGEYLMKKYLNVIIDDVGKSYVAIMDRTLSFCDFGPPTPHADGGRAGGPETRQRPTNPRSGQTVSASGFSSCGPRHRVNWILVVTMGQARPVRIYRK
jgi:hypothetical protein